MTKSDAETSEVQDRVLCHLTARTATAPQTPPSQPVKSELPDDQFNVGQIIGQKYQVLELPQIGGMGYVYKVKHIHTGRLHAVKQPNDKAAGRRFSEKEIKALIELDHPSLPTIMDVCEHGGYVVTKWIEGVNLFVACKEGKELLDPKAAIRVWIQVAEAVVYMHKKGILHRDIKPENILVNKIGDSGDFKAYLIDLGGAKWIDTPTSQTDGFTRFAGTRIWAAPARIFNTVHGDQYVLGMLLCWLLTGSRNLPEKDRLSDSISSFGAIIEKSLNEQIRFASIDSMILELERVLMPASEGFDGNALEVMRKKRSLIKRSSQCKEQLDECQRRLDRIGSTINISVFGVNDSGKSSMLLAWYLNRASLLSEIRLVFRNRDTIKYLRDLRKLLFSYGSLRPTDIAMATKLTFDIIVQGREAKVSVQDYAGEMLRDDMSIEEKTIVKKATRKYSHNVGNAVKRSNILICLLDVMTEEADFSDIFDMLVNDRDIEVVLLVITKFDLVTRSLNRAEYPKDVDELKSMVTQLAERSPLFRVLKDQIFVGNERRAIIPVAALGVDLNICPKGELMLDLRDLKPFQPLEPLKNGLRKLFLVQDRLVAQRGLLTDELQWLDKRLQVIEMTQNQAIAKLESHLFSIQQETCSLFDQLDTDIASLKRLGRRCVEGRKHCMLWGAMELETKYSEHIQLLQDMLAEGKFSGRIRRLNEIRARLDQSNIRTIGSLRGIVGFVTVTFSLLSEPALAALPENDNYTLISDYRSLHLRVVGRSLLTLSVPVVILVVIAILFRIIN